MAQYKLKDVALQYPQLFANVGDEVVTLHGKDESVEVETYPGGPKRIVVKKQATQEQLKALYLQNHPFIEMVENATEKQIEKEIKKP